MRHKHATGVFIGPCHKNLFMVSSCIVLSLHSIENSELKAQDQQPTSEAVRESPQNTLAARSFKPVMALWTSCKVVVSGRTSGASLAEAATWWRSGQAAADRGWPYAVLCGIGDPLYQA